MSEPEDSPDKKPSMADIAARLGVSTMTVSRALRGLPKVSKALQLKVLETALEMGYHHDSEISRVMRLMRLSRADSFFETVGFVMLCPKAILKDGGFFAQMLNGARVRAQQLNYRMDLFYAEDYAGHPERLRDILHARGVRGVLFSPRINIDDGLPFELGELIAVGIGHTHPEEIFNLVRFNHYSGMVTACKHLRALGYRRLALVVDEAINHRMEQRFTAAFASHCSDEPMQEGWNNIFAATPLQPKDVVDFYYKVRPDAMIVAYSDCAKWLIEAGVRIPQDVAVASMNYWERESWFAGVDQCYEEWGARSVDLLTSLIQRSVIGAPRSSQSILVEGVWRDGDSAPAL
jgi:DNA-binding LacI/PurR family transcriptional regulator